MRRNRTPAPPPPGDPEPHVREGPVMALLALGFVGTWLVDAWLPAGVIGAACLLLAGAWCLFGPAAYK